MAWWGSVIGGAVGFMLGGPLGALLGLALGTHYLNDKINFSGFSGGGSSKERAQAAFFTATFSVMGHLAKADGRVTESEIQLTERFMQQLNLDAAQRRAAIELFNQGKKADFPIKQILDQFQEECHRERHLIELFLNALLQVVYADGELSQPEYQALRQIYARLGLSEKHLEAWLHRFQYQQQAGNASSTASANSLLSDAYDLLGVDKETPEAEVKRAYKRLMSENHPDKLVAKGLPEEMIVLATQKSQDISKAYQRIREARGF